MLPVTPGRQGTRLSNALAFGAGSTSCRATQRLYCRPSSTYGSTRGSTPGPTLLRADRRTLQLMTFTDYLLDIGLIALVLLQIRGRRLTARSLLLPFAIVGWAASNYLHGIPTAHNDLFLVGAGASLGLVLGGLCGAFTHVTRGRDGVTMAKAGAVAAALWVVGVGTRFAFQLYATHGGSPAIGRFSASHGITSGAAWTACLILMAIGEVAARSAILALRAYRLRAEGVSAVPALMPRSRRSTIMGG